MPAVGRGVAEQARFVALSDGLAGMTTPDGIAAKERLAEALRAEAWWAHALGQLEGHRIAPGPRCAVRIVVQSGRSCRQRGRRSEQRAPGRYQHSEQNISEFFFFSAVKRCGEARYQSARGSRRTSSGMLSGALMRSAADRNAATAGLALEKKRRVVTGRSRVQSRMRRSHENLATTSYLLFLGEAQVEKTLVKLACAPPSLAAGCGSRGRQSGHGHESTGERGARPED